MSSNSYLDQAEIKQIEQIIGYSFEDKELLRQCFTLASASEHNNERLEFLGDSVIQLCVSEILYRRLNRDEGDMTELRKKFVANEVMRPTVEGLGLDKYLRYAGKKENLGKKPIASLFEALTAGIYLDGGMPAAKKFIVEKLVKTQAEKLLEDKKSKQSNHKGALQEYLQGMGMPLARYGAAEKKGADHNPTFYVSVSAQGHTATGEGGSKTAAEQAAAKKLLEMLRNG
ncbi:MAG: hypothetical protein IJY26_03060 [Clostridia bacterium]|nr:hypothetical protein [Clostridia bacterium]